MWRSALASVPEGRGHSRKVSGGGQVVQLCSSGSAERLHLRAAEQNPASPPRWPMGAVARWRSAKRGVKAGRFPRTSEPPGVGRFTASQNPKHQKNHIKDKKVSA